MEFTTEEALIVQEWVDQGKVSSKEDFDAAVSWKVSNTNGACKVCNRAGLSWAVEAWEKMEKGNKRVRSFYESDTDGFLLPVDTISRLKADFFLVTIDEKRLLMHKDKDGGSHRHSLEKWLLLCIVQLVA